MCAVLFAHVVERADVRMVQAADGFGLTLEAFTALRVTGEMFRQDLDGDSAVEAGVYGAIHFAHTTGTDLVGDLVGAEFCAYHQGEFVIATSKASAVAQIDADATMYSP